VANKVTIFKASTLIFLMVWSISFKILGKIVFFVSYTTLTLILISPFIKQVYNFNPAYIIGIFTLKTDFYITPNIWLSNKYFITWELSGPPSSAFKWYLMT